MLGADMATELVVLQREVVKEKKVIAYDVSAWDRSLPGPIVSHFFASFIDCVFPDESGAIFSQNLARALCGGGTYLVGGELVRFRHPTTAWCSGTLKTLSGNSQIHDALLEVLGYDGVVQGDDGNVFVDATRVEDAIVSLREGFKSVGLTLKIVEAKEHIEFCSLSVFPDGAGNLVAQADLQKLYDKMAAGIPYGYPLGCAAFSLAHFFKSNGVGASLPRMHPDHLEELNMIL